MRPVVFLMINSLYGGGAEHVAARLSKEWVKRYDLKILSLYPFTDKDYVFYGERIYIGRDVSSKFWFSRLKEYSKVVDSLAKQYKPIAIISFLQNSNLINLLTKYKTKKIVSVRNYLPSLHKGIKLLIWKQLIKKYYPKADYVVSVSQLMNREMTTIYGIEEKKCICIYNPYNFEEIKDLAKEEMSIDAKLFYDRHLVISNMGHVKYPKGQYHLVRILPELKKHFPTIGLVIIGDDNTDYARKLKIMIKKLQLEDDVFFTGRQRNPYKYLKNSKCYVFPSLFEGFPNALVEAMICGLPVISADCKSGPREILAPQTSNQYGFLMPVDDTEWISEKKPLSVIEKLYIESIIEILGNEKESIRYSKLAFERANDFTMESINNKWYEIIDN